MPPTNTLGNRGVDDCVQTEDGQTVNILLIVPGEACLATRPEALGLPPNNVDARQSNQRLVCDTRYPVPVGNPLKSK